MDALLNTPSRIPIPSGNAPRTTPSRRPSFASPTKASLARHNPQLLNRPSSSSGLKTERPGSSRGKNLQDLFTKALGEARTSYYDAVISTEDPESGPTTQENQPSTEAIMSQKGTMKLPETKRAVTPRARSMMSGSPRRMSKSPSKRPGMSGIPRRMSKLPLKRLERAPYEHLSLEAALAGNDINPFQKKGLRRSPPAGSQATQPSQNEPVLQEEVINPFRKTGLRRSPISSQPVDTEQQRTMQPEEQLEGRRNGLRRSPISSQLMDREEQRTVPSEEPFGGKKSGLRRSPIASQLVQTEGQRTGQTEETLEGRKNGLRRSPIPALTIENLENAIGNPQLQSEIRRAGLRRSPIAPVEPARMTNINSQPEVQPEIRRAGVRRSPATSGAISEISKSQPQAHSELQTGVPAREDVEKQQEQPKISTTPTEPVPARPTTVAKSVKGDLEKVDHRRNAVERPATVAAAEILSEFPMHRGSQPNNTQKIQKSPALSKVAEILNPFVTRRHEEPELPPTPTQRGIPDPVVTTPPSGIHETPSKKARRSKAHPERVKSSPLKPKDPRPEAAAKQLQTQDRSKSQPQEKTAPAARRRSLRFIPKIDPHAAKKKERDELFQQLQQLQADVALANQENERMRILLESKKKPPQAAMTNPDDLLSMLLRSTAPLVPEPPKRVSLLKAVDAFLPFRPRKKAAVKPTSDKPIPSHLPIALEDPLPYLQAFSPLIYTSSITLLPAIPGDSNSSSQDELQPIMQKHIITASHPSGLFSARVSMVVNSSLLSVESIDILRLDMNAEIELGTFIRARAKATGPGAKDVTNICCAMARWTEVSIQRARFWCQVEEEFGTPEARAKAKRKKKKRKRKVIEEEDDDDEDDEPRTIWTRKHLIPNIGRTSMKLMNEDVELRFEWKISFDYMGEVESALSADARTPSQCKKLRTLLSFL